MHKILRCFSGGGFSSIENQTSSCCLSPAGPAQKIEFVISCQSRNNSMGLGSLRSVAQSATDETWQAAR